MKGPLIIALLQTLCACRAFTNPTNAGDLVTVELTVATRTGGEVTGAVLDHNDHGVVLLSQNIPYVFSWIELDAVSGLQAKKILLERERGREGFTAEDYFSLGQYALQGGRNDLAALEFDRARRLDSSLEPEIRASFAKFRRRNEEWNPPRITSAGGDEGEDGGERPIAAEALNFDVLPPQPDQVRDGVRDAYLRFGDKVREVLGRDIVLVESEHFLIWSDWGPKERERLKQWAEAMYTLLCEQFRLDPTKDIFLAKCPVFCFRSKARFARFARDFDGYDAKGAIGYTRSIEKNGHVHMAFARMGSTPLDYDRFACTLVHEGTHAFLHRVFSNRLLPHWVNEGFAEHTAEHVLGDACPAGENATLLGRQYARFDWPVASFVKQVSPIAVHEYPLAHSLIAFLGDRSPAGIVGMIYDLKDGAELSAALADNFGGLTAEELDQVWKQWIRKSASPPLADKQP